MLNSVSITLFASGQMEDTDDFERMIEESIVDESQSQTNNKPKWENGQCVLAIPSYSLINPSFDLSLCNSTLERKGFQIPVADIEVPLKTALEVPAVRRFMIFNSSLFHFIMAPVRKVRFHAGNSTRLIQERDWYSGTLSPFPLYFVYWDMAYCLQTLTEMLEEDSLAGIDTWSKLQKKMSNLVLVAEVPSRDLDECHSEVEQGSEEQRPLLKNEDKGCTSSSSSSKVTTNYSLIPDASLPAQARAHQLLMTYSAAYVKLLVSDRLSGTSHHDLQPPRNHCPTAPLCLCQFIQLKILK
uniref:Transmembrane protein 268 n=1 Tax=Hippocampus comes TaxID=109280 RepID=A0A3Q2XLN4_HIPCM